MRSLCIVFFALVLAACGDNNSATSKNSGNNTEENVAVENIKLDLDKLPATATVMLELDPSVEDGFDAFGIFRKDGQVVTVGVSEQVAKAGGIDIHEQFQGKVKITISSEHAVSRELYKVYSVSAVDKM